MRSLLALLAVTALAFSLAGCTASDTAADLPPEPSEEGFQDALFQGTPDQGAPAGEASGHGEPQREDGPVEAGMSPPVQVPTFWARQTITISNDFGGAAMGHAFFGVDSGGITIETAEGDGYSIEVLLESHGMTEQDARDALARIEVAHTDALEDDGLHLSTVVKQLPAASPLPFVVVGGGSFAWAELRVTLPAAPAYELGADTSSGEVSVSDLRGPALQLTTSSGDVSVQRVNAGTLQVDTSSGSIVLDTVQADDLEASASSGDVTGEALRLGKALVDTSSGDIDLQGAVDTLEADASSGSIDLEAFARRSGAYKLSTSSGDVDVELLTGDGRAYHVTAEADAGEVDVELPGAETRDEEDDRAEVVTTGFDEALIQTVLDIETSSGDITVSASGADRAEDEDDEDEDEAHDHGSHGSL